MNTEPTPQEQKKTTPADGAQTAQPAAANPSDAAAAFAATTAPAPAKNEEQTDPVQAHRDAVEQGRLKKISDELRAEREKNAELQRKLEEAEKNAQKRKITDLQGYKDMDENGKSLVDALMEELHGGKGAQGNPELDEIKRNQAALAAALAQDNAARAQTEAFSILEKSHPGLLARIGHGDLKDKWEAFLGRTDEYAGRTYNEIVAGANARGSGAALARVALEFVRSNDLEGQYVKQPGTPRPAGASAAPADAGSSGKPFYDSRDEIGKLYTQAVYDAASGKITQEEKAQKLAELKSALEEKRYRT